jgi:zinc protease
MYTNRIFMPNMVVQTIEPIDARIVRVKLTCDLSHEAEGVSDIELSFFADLLGTKTATKDKAMIISMLNKNGIRLMIEGGEQSLTCTMTVTKEKFGAALAILKDILLNAEVAKDEFTRTQKRTLEELREARDDARRIARINFSRALYANGDPRHSETLAEQVATVTRLTTRHFTTLKRNMLGGRWYLSAVLDPSDHATLTRFARAFSHDTTLPERSAKQTTLPRSRSVYETVSGRTNVELRLGHRLTLTQTSEDYPALAFGLSIFGEVGGFGGRLMSTVREKEGLTYGIYARIEATEATRPGHWNIYTFFTAKDLHKGIASTMHQFAVLLEKGVTARECAVFKETYQNEFLIRHESNERRLGYYHALLTLGLDEAWAGAFQEKIAALTVREVNDALRTHLDPKRLVSSGAGPVTKTGKGIV